MPFERCPRPNDPRERLYWMGPEALADAGAPGHQLGSGIRGKTAIDVAREMPRRLRLAGRRGGARGRPSSRRSRRRAGQARPARRRVRADPAPPGAHPGRARHAVGSSRSLRGVRAAHGGSQARGVPDRAARRAERSPARPRGSRRGPYRRASCTRGHVFKPAILEVGRVGDPAPQPSERDPTPGREDVRLTRQLVECARLLDLRIHDHLVIGRGRFVSLAEKASSSSWPASRSPFAAGSGGARAATSLRSDE